LVHVENSAAFGGVQVFLLHLPPQRWHRVRYPDGTLYDYESLHNIEELLLNPDESFRNAKSRPEYDREQVRDLDLPIEPTGLQG